MDAGIVKLSLPQAATHALQSAIVKGCGMRLVSYNYQRD